jgi:zinc transporter
MATTTIDNPAADHPVRAQMVTGGFAGGGFAGGFRFGPSGVQPLRGEDLGEVLADRDGWLWLDFDLGDERLATTLAALPELPPAVQELLLSTDAKVQADTFGKVIAGIANDYEKRTPLDAKYGVRWRFALLPQLLVTVRPRLGHALSQVQADVPNGRHFRDPVHLLGALLNEFGIASYSMVVEIGNRINETEERLLDDAETQASEVPGGVRRRLLYLHRQVIPVLGVLNHLLPQRPDWFGDADLADYRRIAERLRGVHDEIELLRERAHTLQEDFQARESERTNRRLTVLTVVSALLLPPSVISGILGMNVGGQPLVGNPLGFLIAGAAMGASVVVMLLILRRIRLI